MIKKYPSTKSINELSEYMDTLVRYVFYKLKKTKDKHDTIYYPAYYLYRDNIDEFKDVNHLDEGYKFLTITLRKINNSNTIIIVKLEGIDNKDWRYDILNTLYKKALDAIDKSINDFNYKKGI